MGALDGFGALVTGGGSGIGLACARRLAADGASVTICGRTEAKLREAAGDELQWVVADVTDENQSSWITGETISVDGGHHLRRGPDYTAFAEPLYGADALRGRLEKGGA